MKLMTLEEIDDQLASLEQQRTEITAQMRDLHEQRGQITDEQHAKTVLDGMTPSQRDVVIRVAALEAKAELPQAQ